MQSPRCGRGGALARRSPCSRRAPVSCGNGARGHAHRAVDGLDVPRVLRGGVRDRPRRLGYDGVEVMVWTDPVSQDADGAAGGSRDLPRRAGPRDPRAVPAAHATGLGRPTRGRSSTARRRPPSGSAAQTVVVHPPFRWQREYARGFVDGLPADAGRDRRPASRSRTCSRCGPRPRGRRRTCRTGTRSSRLSGHVTLDLSHTAVSAVRRAGDGRALGDRLAHVHLADGIGSRRTSTSCPAAATQPCARAAGAPGGQRLRRDRRASRSTPAGPRPGRARGRPRRGAGVRAAPLAAVAQP